MNETKRLEILERLNARNHLVHCSLQEVQRLDEYLKTEWGIRLPASQMQVFEGIYKRAGEQILSHLNAYRIILGAARTRRASLRSGASVQFESVIGPPIQGSVECTLYDLVAENSLQDLWFSQDRTYTLDVLAYLRSLVRHLQVTGPILDVGCNTGHMAIWLARETGLRVVGVDASTKSLAIAKERSKDLATVDFHVMDYAQEGFDQGYDMIYCSRGFPDEQDDAPVLKNIAQALRSGGICVLIGVINSDWKNAKLRKIAQRYQLGFGMIDKVGAWSTVDSTYSYQDVMVLVKGVHSPLPPKMKSGQVSCVGFQEYIEAETTRPEEKTIAYFRAKKAAGLLDLDAGKNKKIPLREVVDQA